MKKILKTKTLFLFLFTYLLSFANFAQEAIIYSEVEIISHQENLVDFLNSNGLAIDHFKRTDKGIACVVKRNDIQILEDLNIGFNILVDDKAKDYERRRKENKDETLSTDFSFQNFDFGSLGGYHSYAEVLASIDSMHVLFPDYVKLIDIGTTFEGRSIMAIKISDNVQTDESDVEGVAYFDALTHAREPNGMFSILFFMWYLLENQNTDNEMNYIINNRELYFVPVVNPDGYVYNETTNPNGGGFWRKNRAVNAGSSCIGVDLNRNFGALWGVASSTNPCADDFRGGSAFSELESQAVRNLVDSIQPKTVLSNHAFSDLIITSQDGLSAIGDNLHREYANEFCSDHYEGYGQVGDILGFSGTGATIEYITSAHQCTGFTPEIGTFFWESSNNIIWNNAESLFPMFKFLAYAAGEYAAFQDFSLLTANPIRNGFSNDVAVRLYNKGHSLEALNVTAELSCLHPSIALINSSSSYGNITERSYAANTSNPFSFEVVDDVLPNEEIKFKVAVFQNNGFSYADSFYLYAGETEVLFEEMGENNLDNWINDAWAITDVVAYEGAFCIADSPEANYSSNEDNTILMDTTVDLAASQNPFLFLHAKWSLQPNSDNVKIKISLDEGLSWDNINGANFTGTQHWQQIKIDLKDYVLAGNDKVRFGFFLSSDFSRQSDGFYFDNLKIVDIKDAEISDINNFTNLTDLEVAVFPSLVDDFVKIEILKEGFNHYNLEIYDLNNRLIVRQQDILDKTIRLETHNWSAGAYTVRISNANFSSFKKIVKN